MLLKFWPTDRQGNFKSRTFKHFPMLVKCFAKFVLFSCSWKFQWNVCKEGFEMQFRVLYSPPHLLSCLFMHWEISGGVWDAKQGNNITRTYAIVDNYYLSPKSQISKSQEKAMSTKCAPFYTMWKGDSIVQLMSNLLLEFSGPVSNPHILDWLASLRGA